MVPLKTGNACEAAGRHVELLCLCVVATAEDYEQLNDTRLLTPSRPTTIDVS